MKHLVIPDAQIKPGYSTAYLRFIGNYIVAKRPDVIVNIGDFADMPSLSSYDKGTKAFEGRRYRNDINAAINGMENLLRPIAELNIELAKQKKKLYKPRMVLTLGNHENRINKAINNDAMLDGTIGMSDLRYEDYGWEVHPFLEVVVIDGIAYSHYFTSGLLGRPVGSSAALLNKKHMSCIAGHQQGLQISTAYKADGNMITGIIAGSCYEHDEDYLGPQGNKHWRGILMAHDVHDGAFDVMPVSLKYLQQKYAY